MYFALVNGGPAAWFWSYVVVAFGALCQAATFSEMASIQPIAGAQYYWTWNFSPPKFRKFLTWIQGWATWTGYVALLASCVNSNTTLLIGMIQLSYPDFSSGGWHTTVINFATIVVCTGVNLFAFWLVPWFELLTGILNVTLFVIFAVVLWVMSPRNTSDVFFQTNMSSGWDNYYISSNIGALSSIFLFVCELSSAPRLCHVVSVLSNDLDSVRECHTYGRRDPRCQKSRTEGCFLCRCHKRRARSHHDYNHRCKALFFDQGYTPSEY